MFHETASRFMLLFAPKGKGKDVNCIWLLLFRVQFAAHVILVNIRVHYILGYDMWDKCKDIDIFLLFVECRCHVGF